MPCEGLAGCYVGTVPGIVVGEGSRLRVDSYSDEGLGWGFAQEVVSDRAVDYCERN